LKKNLDLNGKNILDIGAHIGYYTMCFSELVGNTGSVYAFEPNIFNVERMKLILSRNDELKSRIKIYDIAISDKTGDLEFNFSSNIDIGTSSGGFVKNAHTPFNEDVYKDVGFKKMNVKTISLDRFISEKTKDIVPYLLKIDVEGAEYLVLEGAKSTIKKYRPFLLIEVHSIFNMFKICDFFYPLGYTIKLLTESACFIIATP